MLEPTACARLAAAVQNAITGWAVSEGLTPDTPEGKVALLNKLTNFDECLNRITEDIA